MPLLSSSSNKGLLLRGVTAAGFPALVGTVVHEREAPFQLAVPSAVPGVLTCRVVRQNADGLLGFYYRLRLTEADYDDELRMAVSFAHLGAALQFADFRVDGPGSIPPNKFDSSVKQPFSFQFNYGLSVGRESRFCFVSTNAREFAETGAVLHLITGRTSAALDVPTPTATAPTAWIPAASSAAENAGAQEESSVSDSPHAQDR